MGSEVPGALKGHHHGRGQGRLLAAVEVFLQLLHVGDPKDDGIPLVSLGGEDRGRVFAPCAPQMEQQVGIPCPGLEAPT